MTDMTDAKRLDFQRGFPGFENLFRAELSRWFGTRRWLGQAVLWTLLIDGMIAMIGIVSKVFEEMEAGAADARQIFGLIAVIGSIGTVIILQNVIINEKENGVASWILSKPVSRGSYVLAKLLGNAAGVMVCVIMIPGLFLYPLISLMFVGSWLPLGNFLLALAVLALEILFYLSLTVMLGTAFEKRGAVLGLPLVLIFGQQAIIGLIGRLIYVLPYSLSTITAGSILLGEEIQFVTPLLTTPVFILLFGLLAGYLFRREEF